MHACCTVTQEADGADIAETDALSRDTSAGVRSVFGWLSRRSFKKGRGRFGLSAGGYVGGDVGRRMDRRRQWAMAKYACLGVTLPSALAECGSSRGGLAALPLRTRARWYARVARVWTRIWTFRSMQDMEKSLCMDRTVHCRLHCSFYMVCTVHYRLGYSSYIDCTIRY